MLYTYIDFVCDTAQAIYELLYSYIAIVSHISRGLRVTEKRSITLSFFLSYMIFSLLLKKSMCHDGAEH